MYGNGQASAASDTLVVGRFPAPASISCHARRILITALLIHQGFRKDGMQHHSGDGLIWRL